MNIKTSKRQLITITVVALVFIGLFTVAEFSQRIKRSDLILYNAHFAVVGAETGEELNVEIYALSSIDGPRLTYSPPGGPYSISWIGSRGDSPVVSISKNGYLNTILPEEYIDRSVHMNFVAGPPYMHVVRLVPVSD